MIGRVRLCPSYSFATALDSDINQTAGSGGYLSMWENRCMHGTVCLLRAGQPRRAGAAAKSGQFVGQFSWVTGDPIVVKGLRLKRKAFGDRAFLTCKVNRRLRPPVDSCSPAVALADPDHLIIVMHSMHTFQHVCFVWNYGKWGRSRSKGRLRPRRAGGGGSSVPEGHDWRTMWTEALGVSYFFMICICKCGGWL